MFDAFDIEPGQAFAVGPALVTIDTQDSPENPWENWDCQTPLIWGNGQRFETLDSGDDIANFFKRVSSAWVSRHWRAICKPLDLDESAHDRDSRDNIRGTSSTLSDSRWDMFTLRLEELESDASDSWAGQVDFFDALESLYKMLGLPCLSFQRDGYSQGDSVVGFLVATPEHAARCGFDLAKPGHDIKKSLEGDADLFGAWAFGDVYGYTLEDADGDHLDSCWGFYGAYWDGDSTRGGYVLEAAKEALRGVASGKVDDARAVARDARAAFLATRKAWKEARATLGAWTGSAATPRTICKALDDVARDLAAKLDAARAESVAWATLARGESI